MRLSQIIFDSLQRLGKSIKIEDYDFLDNSADLHTPVMICLGGSHAYGTNIEKSDLDIRGIAMHSADDILLNRGFEQIINNQTDTTIYSLEKIVHLLTNCNPNIIEMLGAKKEHYLYLSDIGNELLKRYDMFLSMRCVGSFMGYANSQMYRLQQKSLIVLSEQELNAHIAKTLNGMMKTLEEQHGLVGVVAHLDNCDQIVLDIPEMKNYPAEKLSMVLNTLNKTLQDYHRNSKRNENAIEHGKIAKHSMHLLRLYMMCEDILLYGKINTYREKEHNLLMDIRNGLYLDSDEKPNAEFFDIVHDYEARLDYAKEHSVLPQKPDMKRIDKFLKEANEMQVRKAIH